MPWMLLERKAVTPASSGSKRKTWPGSAPWSAASSASTTTTVREARKWPIRPRPAVSPTTASRPGPNAPGTWRPTPAAMGPPCSGVRSWPASARSRRTTATPTPSSPISVLPTPMTVRRRRASGPPPPESPLAARPAQPPLPAAVRAVSSARRGLGRPPLEQPPVAHVHALHAHRAAFLPEEHQRELPRRLDGDDVHVRRRDHDEHPHGHVVHLADRLGAAQDVGDGLEVGLRDVPHRQPVNASRMMANSSAP